MNFIKSIFSDFNVKITKKELKQWIKEKIEFEHEKEMEQKIALDYKKSEKEELWEIEIAEVMSDKSRWRHKKDEDGRDVWMNPEEIINYEREIGVYGGFNLWN